MIKYFVYLFYFTYLTNPAHLILYGDVQHTPNTSEAWCIFACSLLVMECWITEHPVYKLSWILLGHLYAILIGTALNKLSFDTTLSGFGQWKRNESQTLTTITFFTCIILRARCFVYPHQYLFIDTVICVCIPKNSVII